MPLSCAQRRQQQWPPQGSLTHGCRRLGWLERHGLVAQCCRWARLGAAVLHECGCWSQCWLQARLRQSLPWERIHAVSHIPAITCRHPSMHPRSEGRA